MRLSCRISLCAIILLLYLETVVSQLADKSAMEQHFDKWSFLPNNTPDKRKQYLKEARHLMATEVLLPRWKKRIGFAGLDNMDVMTSILGNTRQKDTSNPTLRLSTMDLRKLMEAGK